MDNCKTLIWDWNGTLLNDTGICIDAMNLLLKSRNLPALDLDRYRQIFTFPVREYYILAGFDFESEPFDIPAMQFIDNYRELVKFAALQQGAENALGFFSRRGLRQAVLSVMEQQLLEESVGRYGIAGFFDTVSGIDNHFGHGKLELAIRVINEMEVPKNDILLVGDTLHDHEVAQETGIACILIAHGHQSAGRLKTSGRMVVNNFDELLSLF